jgi:uncharacterized protein with von Willebrand factor type A (vWA) domain
MSTDDLRKMFDLGAKAPAPSGGGADWPDEALPGAEASPTALVLDEWALRRGRDLLAEIKPMKEYGADEYAVADFFGAAFEPEPTLAGGCKDGLRRRFMEDLLSLPDYHALHQDTCLEQLPSELAACKFAAQFKQFKDRHGPEKPEPARKLDSLKSAARAVKEAAAEAGELADAALALGGGMGPGERGRYDPRKVAELFRGVRADARLRRIFDLAGRFRRLARSLQRRKSSHGVDDTVGVTLGGDLRHALPCEVARLVEPGMELDFLRRLVERQLMCREHKASEPVGRGPVMVVVDECLHPDTPIPMADGTVKPIREVLPGDTVLSFNFAAGEVLSQKVGRVAEVPADGEVYVIRTPEGTVTASGTHRFFTVREGRIAEVRANELRVGDAVATPMCLPQNEAVVSGPEALVWAECLGGLCGDGNAWLDRKRCSARVTLHDEDIPHLERHAGMYRQLGYKPLIRHWSGKNKLIVNSRKLYDLVTGPEYDGILHKQPVRFIPDTVLRWPGDMVRAFLRGLFDAEGNVGHHQVSMLSSSERLVNQTQHLLRRCGVFSSKTLSRNTRSGRVYPKLYIGDHTSLVIFRDEIGFGMPAKQELLNGITLNQGQQRKSIRDRVPVDRATLRLMTQRVGLKNGRPDGRLLTTLSVVWRSRQTVERLLNAVEQRLAVIDRLNLTEVDGELIAAVQIPKERAGRGAGLSKKMLQRYLAGGGPCRQLRNLQMSSFIRSEVEAARDQAMELRRILSGNICWSPIRAVDQISVKPEKLYDLTMDGPYANYVAAGCVVHNSGSMGGEKVYQAKALALTMAWLAKSQNRWCALVAYSGGTGERLLKLAPGRWDESAVVDWLTGFLGRGSDRDVPVAEMPRYYRELDTPRGQTDVVFVTDAICRLSGAEVAEFNAWKQGVKARVYSLIIQSRPGPLEQVSDEVFVVSTLSCEELGIERVLSI